MVAKRCENDPQNKDDDRGDVVGKEGEESAQEGDHDPLPHFWHHAHDLLVGDLSSGVDAGNGVDHGGGGEEGEDEEEGEVDGFDEEITAPFGGDDVAEPVVPAASDLGLHHVVLVADDLAKEDLRDLYVCEEDEGEREDQRQSYLAEDLPP